MVHGMQSTDADAGPLVTADGVTFRLHHPPPDLTAAWLFQEVAMPRGGWELEPGANGGPWQLRFPRPPVDRMEYLVELLYEDGRTELIRDPANPLHGPGPFGDKSVIEFPGYRPPAWTAPVQVPAGEVEDFEIEVPSLGERQRTRIWSPPGTVPDRRLPLLVAHDGIEYAEFSGLVRMLERLSYRGGLPPMRAALLHPMRRGDHYSASPAYAEALAREILPSLARRAPSPPGRRWRVGMGASLGALAMLHLHRLHPPTLGGLFLQSGSFFHHRYDPHNLPFEEFLRIRRFMDRVHADRDWSHPVPVVITCGTVEENLANNRATGLVLARQGYPVRFVPSRDGHNWTAWRDLFDPHLVGFLKELWG
jgi:enterochelin esterase-like enzyme